MAVKMRLRRMGQKKAPFYRIVVADSRSPRDGRFHRGDRNLRSEPRAERNQLQRRRLLKNGWLTAHSRPKSLPNS